MADREYKMIKGSGRNYFFDINEAKSGGKYLKITESRWDKGEEKGKRFSLLVFKEDLEEFAKTLANTMPLLAS